MNHSDFAVFQDYSKNVVTQLDKMRFGLLYLHNQSGGLGITVSATIQIFIATKILQNHPLQSHRRSRFAHRRN